MEPQCSALHLSVEEGVCILFILKNVIITGVADAFVSSTAESHQGEIVVVHRSDLLRIPEVYLLGEPPLLVNSRNAFPVVAKVFVQINLQVEVLVELLDIQQIFQVLNFA